MFHDIPAAMRVRMAALEAIDARDRQDGTPRLQRLRQIRPQTGRFLALQALRAPQEGAIVEIGASAGYSTMWLALAARHLGRTVTTFEVLEAKQALARETFEAAQVGDLVRLVGGDARDHLAQFEAIAFCFLDAEKEVYADCYELVIPRLVRGGMLVADNAINHAPTLQPMIDRALADTRVAAMVAPIDNGLLLCCKL